MHSCRSLAVATLLGLTAALPNGNQSSGEVDTYDYVIVGGGVTGLIVANRLTEDKNKTVLVIEAGRADDNPNIRLPFGATYPLNTSLLWPNYVSDPEPELGNKTWNTRVAQVLGGGSVVNGMVYDRGSAADYNAWEALGNDGWGWEGMYPFFKKGTEFIPPPKETAEEFGITWDPEAYGKGPLKVGISDFQFPDVKDYFKAFKGAGAHMPRDGNNGEAYGASWFPNTMNPKTGERSHARNSYYDPVSTRSNLKLWTETVATELVFESGRELTAKGVKVTDKKTGKSTTVYARKEVVLAAGAVNTPKLLQLSGIGPKSVLQAAGIKVKLENDGVGANFQDHPYTTIAFNISNMSFPNPGTLSSNATFNASAWEQHRTSKTGPLTQARGNSLAFIPLPQVDPKNYRGLAKQVLDLKKDAYLPAIYKNSKTLLKGVRAQRKVLADLYQNDEAGVVEYPVPAAGSFVLVAHQKPLSRGSITINPTNPQGPPRIFYNALSNPIDKSVLASCVRYIRTVWARPELKKYSLVERTPGPQYTSDEDIIKKSVELGSVWPTLAHPSGSCAMMPEDLGGCVSNELLFYGVNRLSIVDASILPLIPAQHIQSTMYAVGEKAAHIIKNRW
ncbi:GMC oxidoreductase [Cucurbitaria berberidis CBS 394.84]|uniref:GMC oxidoreductase n=1 Tax=Cucurbitaria berberidis CBS 394.84 TaxID=1168544 RepID=A0A9P4GIR3_9PLEO|nr:GMC oxidoreductase [Cucurbitaria berberidis CBS 394.84]KAF1846928.1 GMC oxidoreductase [Cucurbitaria berberidis CBS 394.84]